jgi:hypothetical protein
MVNYLGKKTLLFLGLKYRSNLLSYCRNLPSFQGKFDVINIPMVIQYKMAVNYSSICFITLAPGYEKISEFNKKVKNENLKGEVNNAR